MGKYTRLLYSRGGFVLAFWRVLSEDQRKGSEKSHREIYEELEKERFAALGVRCFPSFDAFRKYRDRDIKKQQL